MQLIACPHCGPRAQAEFEFDRAMDSVLALDASTEDAVARLYERENPKGWSWELWRHSAGCGVFLKLYLDRHNSEPFITASLVIHSVSPAFAFSTCLFDMFKAHAVEVSVNVGLSASHRQLESCVGRIAAGAATMLLQAMAYLSLAVLIDSRHASWARAALGLQS